ncbi:amino acid ABC transporter permease [Streptomyces sp. NPDC021093]|uniref:amino acid ABC transporter permease n=1 Tax=Streptomyces sp. NPDC021093 TaxID=3365112 RepID=UPI0037BA4B68
MPGFLDPQRYDVLGAFAVTVQLALWSAAGALVWGTVLAALRVSPVPVMRLFSAGYVTVVRNTPLTVIVVAASLGLHQTLGMALGGDTAKESGFRLAVLALAAYTATFVCESLRSGINSVDAGQTEAARALGLSLRQVLVCVVFPQAFRSVVVPLATVLMSLTKNTTVAAAIGVAEAALLMKEMIENEADVMFAVFGVFALGFVCLTLPVGLLLNLVGRRVAVRR